MHEPWVKYAYSGILIVNHMAYAMCVTAIGPVLTEMVDILRTTTESLTLFTTFTSTGFLIGSFFCFSLKYLNRQFVWTIFVVIMSFSTAFVPHSPNLGSLYGCALGIGLGSGVLNTIINVWLTEMWKEKSPPVLQIPGLTFGIGTILSPLIIKPYLSVRHMIPNTPTMVNSTRDSDFHWEYNKQFEEERRAKLTFPFVILGCFQFFFPVLMMIMFIVKRYKYGQNDISQEIELEDKEYKLFDRQRQSRRIVVILFGALLATFNIYECMYYTFAVTYFQYSPLHLDAPKASEVITGFTASYTLFRGFSCLIALKLLPKYMLSVNYGISIVGIVLLASAKSLTMLWVANIVVGIGCSALMQTTFAFVGQHIRMTDVIATILIVFLGSFNIAPPYILGLFIKNHSIVFILVQSFTLIVCILIFALLLIIIDRYEKMERSKQG